MSELKTNFAFVRTSGEGEFGLVVFVRLAKKKANESRWVRAESYALTPPKFICLSENKILFVLNNDSIGSSEVKNVGTFHPIVRGMLRSYEINPTTGSLTLLSMVQTGGSNPVHMCISKAHDVVVVAQDHSVVVFELSQSGVIGHQTCLYRDQFNCFSHHFYQPIQVYLVPRKIDKPKSVSQNLLILEKNLERIVMHRLENKEVKSELVGFWERRQSLNASISKIIVDERRFILAINYDSDIISVFDRNDVLKTPLHNLKINPLSSDVLEDEVPSPGNSSPQEMDENRSLDDSEKTATPDNTSEQVESSMLDINASALDQESTKTLSPTQMASAVEQQLKTSGLQFAGEDATASGLNLQEVEKELESKTSESELDNAEKLKAAAVKLQKKVMPEQSFFDGVGFSLIESGAAAMAEAEAAEVAEVAEPEAAENPRSYWDVVVNFKLSTIYVVKSSSVIEIYKMSKTWTNAITHLRSEILPDNKLPKSLKLKGDKLFVCTNEDIVVYKLFDKRVPIERKNYTLNCSNADQIVFYNENENSVCNYL